MGPFLDLNFGNTRLLNFVYKKLVQLVQLILGTTKRTVQMSRTYVTAIRFPDLTCWTGCTVVQVFDSKDFSYRQYNSPVDVKIWE